MNNWMYNMNTKEGFSVKTIKNTLFFLYTLTGGG